MKPRYRSIRVFLGITVCALLALASGPPVSGGEDKPGKTKAGKIARREAPALTAEQILKSYPVPAGQAEPLARLLQQIYRDSSAVRITAVGNNVLIYAGPNDQFTIARHLLESVPAQIVEVIPLAVLEVRRTGELLRTLFGPSGFVFEADPERNAIIGRGTREQIDEVKAALRVLGEGAVPAGGMRVINLQNGSASDLANELEKLLSKMRANPVQVISPDTKSEPGAKPAVPPKGGPPAKKDGKPAPRVTLTALGNKLVVASEDPEALALIQQLVRLLNTQQHGELQVVRVQHASAAEAARVLDEVFNGKPGRGPGAARIERVRIVVDPMSNSLLIRATPLDMVTIRRLLSRSIDAPSAGSEAALRTFIIPLRHASAVELGKVLRDVYHGEKPAVSVTPEPRSNSLILRCSLAIFEDAKKLVEQLDMKAEKK